MVHTGSLDHTGSSLGFLGEKSAYFRTESFGSISTCRFILSMTGTGRIDNLRRGKQDPWFELISKLAPDVYQIGVYFDIMCTLTKIMRR